TVDRLPSARIDETIDICKVVDQESGLMFSQFLAAPGAGGDGDGAGAKGFAACDVARRIADDVDLGSGKLATMFFFSTRPGERAELVAIVVIVGKRAEFKKMPDAVML